MNDLICPNCQLPNAQAVTHCQRCGFPLQNNPLLDRSTLGMPTFPDSSGSVSADDCTAHLTGLSHGAILFLVNINDRRERVVFENAQSIMIGRYNDEQDMTFLDMSHLGEVAFGISRRHAQITRQGDHCFIEDLDSTNGTWLNRQRLPPHELFPLSCGDVVYIGPVLKMVICYHPIAGEEAVTQFILRPTKSDTNEAPSLQFFSAHIMTYLETIHTVQQLINDYQDHPHQTTTLISLHLQDGGYVIALAGAAEAVHLLQTGLNPWQSINARSLEKNEGETLRPALTQLAAQLLGNLTAVSSDDRFPFIERLAGTLAVAVNTPVHLQRLPE